MVGKITNYYGPFPDGITRVLLVGDPTRGMGSLAEAECRRVIAALDLAKRLRRSPGLSPSRGAHRQIAISYA